MTEIEEYHRPATVEEAAAILARGPATVLAGGTDLMLQGASAPTLVNIRKVEGLDGIVLDGGEIRIGALATVTDLLADVVVAENLPPLHQAADQFASSQIRNMATVGGNICNASPAGDLPVALLALDAEVELASMPDRTLETRRLPLCDFFTGPGATRREPGELLVSVHVAVPAQGAVGGFAKFGPRPALEVAIVAVAIVGVLDGPTLNNVRVGFGAVAPTPIRGAATEAALEGQALDAQTIARAAEAARGEITPISDHRASDWYRRHLVGALTEEILSHAVQG